jgi:hypothetical protein
VAGPVADRSRTRREPVANRWNPDPKSPHRRRATALSGARSLPVTAGIALPCPIDKSAIAAAAW